MFQGTHNMFVLARDCRTWILCWPRLILRNVNENQLLWDFKYLIIYFIYSALYSYFMLHNVYYKASLYFSHEEDSPLLRENIFENICCYIRACLWELQGICADLLNHPLESNKPYFLSASITCRYALKRDCNQKENISEPRENTCKWNLKKN